MKKGGVLGIGVATMDIYPNQRRMYPGGNEFNVACNAKFQGIRSGFLGVFGDDLAGKLLEKALQDCDVDTSYCHHEMGSSGYSLVELKEDGDRIFLDWNKQGVTDLYPIQFTDKELDYVKSFDVVSLGRCASVSLDKIQFLYKNQVDICYDFHAIYSNIEIETFAPLSKYCFFSCSHLSFQEILDTLKKAVDCGCSIAIGTRGSYPILAYDGIRYYEQETYKVKPIDALGAGDSYIGAFLANYLKNPEMSQENRIQMALERAAFHSSTVVMKEGSIGIGYDVDPDNLDKIVHIKK